MVRQKLGDWWRKFLAPVLQSVSDWWRKVELPHLQPPAGKALEGLTILEEYLTRCTQGVDRANRNYDLEYPSALPKNIWMAFDLLFVSGVADALGYGTQDRTRQNQLWSPLIDALTDKCPYMFEVLFSADALSSLDDASPALHMRDRISYILRFGVPKLPFDSRHIVDEWIKTQKQ